MNRRLFIGAVVAAGAAPAITAAGPVAPVREMTAQQFFDLDADCAGGHILSADGSPGARIKIVDHHQGN